MFRLVPAARLGLSLLLSLLVVGESAGVARAMGLGSTVSCCCGRHVIARPCPCSTCPARRRLVESSDGHAHASAAVIPVGTCMPSSEAGVLAVLATPTIAPAFFVPRLVAELALETPLALRSIAIETARPPP